MSDAKPTDSKPTDPPTAPAGPDRFRFDGKLVLISGAGGAFGRAAMRGFARAGATVFGVDVNAESLEETRRLVQADGGNAAVATADVGDPAAVAKAFDALDSAFGGIDVLINNAGINPQQAEAEAFPLDVWNTVLRINLTSVLLMSQQAARRMIAAGRGGSIVNVSSIAGSSVLGRGNMGFGVSKSGVEQLTRELAVEWAHHGIRVNGIEPCQFINEGLQSLIDNPAKAPLVQRMISGIPIGRMGTPDEVVGPMMFLASPAASMVTGVIMPVDGGNLAFNAGGSLPNAAGLPTWRS
jgi:NAD(P)-dependent dehydrogenase (short-subunit alcohol dehydrogenase family)